MNATETIDGLRLLADQLEAVSKAPHFEPQEITIAEAFQRLRAVIPTDYIALRIPGIDSFRPGEYVMKSWQVYDGHAHYEGATLIMAVSACLLAHRDLPVDADALATVQQALDQLDTEPAF